MVEMLIVLTLAGSSPATHVSATGSIEGTVTDSDGYVVPGVMVTLRLPGEGDRVAYTDREGDFRFCNDTSCARQRLSGAEAAGRAS